MLASADGCWSDKNNGMSDVVLAGDKINGLSDVVLVGDKRTCDVSMSDVNNRLSDVVATGGSPARLNSVLDSCPQPVYAFASKPATTNLPDAGLSVSLVLLCLLLLA